MKLTPGDVFYIYESYAVLLGLEDSSGNYGYLLAGLNALGSRVDDPQPYNRMVNYLRFKGARYITTLSGISFQEYVTPLIGPLRPDLRNAMAYGTIYRRWGQFPNTELFLAVSVTSSPVRHALIPLSDNPSLLPQWTGSIVNDNYHYVHFVPFGTVRDRDVWPQLEFLAEREGEVHNVG